MAILVSVGLAISYAYLFTFSRFLRIDDQGYLMISVRSFLQGQPLYDTVFTQYGPVYYFYQWLLHGPASIPVTHDVAGVFCMCHWLLAAALLAIAGGRMSGSALAGLFLFFQAVTHLKALTNEPGHPQELIAVLLAAAACVAAKAPATVKRRVLLGFLAAALVFIKINVGVFFCLALLLALITNSVVVEKHRFWSVAALAGMSLLPFLLMRQHLAEPWARQYGWRIAASVISAGCVGYCFTRERTCKLPVFVQIAAAFAGGSLALALGTVLSGSSFTGLLNGMVLSPLKLAGVFCWPVMLEHGAVSAGVSVMLALALVLWRRHLDRLRFLLVTAKLLFGLVCAMSALNFKLQLGILLPWTWLLLIPTGEEKTDTAWFGRTFLCQLAAWQGLQAYPVDGTQTALATLLLVPISVLCLSDGLRVLSAAATEARAWPSIPVTRARVLRGLALACLAALFALKWCPLAPAHRYYATTEALDLPGAHLFHLPCYQKSECERLAHYLQSACDTFVTEPGMNSFYFWAGKQPPTSLNTTAWMVLLNDAQQNQILSALQRAKRPLVVVHEPQLRFWQDCTRGGQGPLVAFINNQCREIASFDGYRILAPR